MNYGEGVCGTHSVRGRTRSGVTRSGSHFLSIFKWNLVGDLFEGIGFMLWGGVDRGVHFIGC